MEDFSENNKKYSWSRDMLPATKELDQFFKKDAILRESDYILDGTSALKTYNLIRNVGVYRRLTVSLSTRALPQTYTNRLKNSPFDNIMVLRRISTENINKFVNHDKRDCVNNMRRVKLPTLERLLVDIDIFPGQPDELERAEKRLKQIVSIPKLKKVMKYYSETSQKISKAARDLIRETKTRKYLVRREDDTDRINNILTLIKDTEAVVFGGIAVEKQKFTDHHRATFDIDILLSKEETKKVLKKIGTEYYINDGSRFNERKDSNKTTIFSGGYEKSTIFVSNAITDKKENKTIEDALKINAYHGLDNLVFKELLKSEFIHEDSRFGKLLCPEALLCFKLCIIQNSISTVSKWQRRVVKDALDIRMLRIWCHIDERKLLRAYKFFSEKAGMILDFKKFDIFMKISKTKDYIRVMFNLLVNNCINLSYGGSGESVCEVVDFIKASNKPIVKKKNVS